MIEAVKAEARSANGGRGSDSKTNASTFPFLSFLTLIARDGLKIAFHQQSFSFVGAFYRAKMTLTSLDALVIVLMLN